MTNTQPEIHVDLERAGKLLIIREIPSSVIEVINPLGGGFTNAQVLLVDISGSPVKDLDGQFVLKVELSHGHPQSVAHSQFCSELNGFADHHVPKLLKSIEDQGVRADLYDIAGHSLQSVRTVDRADYADQEKVCAQLAEDLIHAQMGANGKPDYTTTAGQIIESWLGSGFPNNNKGRRLRDLAATLGVTKPGFEHEGEFLPCPLTLLSPGSALYDESLPSFSGACHGDLHLRNVLVKGSRQSSGLEYWVIDINWHAHSPLLYDQAYLELAAFLNVMPRVGHGRLMPILGEINETEVLVNVALDHTERSVVTFAKEIRSRVIGQLEQLQPKRKDIWSKQYLLAQVAAGLNWAAKPLRDESARAVSFLSAAWSARQLLRSDPKYTAILVNLNREVDRQQIAPARSTAVSAAEAVARWRIFQSTNSGTDLFLITDGAPATENMIGLSHSRWMAVFDLDPNSDTNGVASKVVPSLKKVRHVSVFGRNTQVVPPASATNWLMANGWSSHSEEVPSTNTEWRRNGYLADARSLIDEVHRSTPNKSAAVLCIRSGARDELVDRVLDYVDEKYGGIADKLDLASVPSVQGFDLSAFLDAISASLPSLTAGPTRTIPSATDPLTLSSEDLHRLDVDVEVLHSEVLAESLASSTKLDDFWRGRPPTWDELEAHVDVRRTIFPQLKSDLDQHLSDHRLAVIELYHSPGAGATTLARRAAWDLHRKWPTVLLRNYSTSTAERIDEIYQATGTSVLIIAEAAELPESDLNQLCYALRQRNSRAVILWNKRTNLPNLPQRRKNDGQRHVLVDPMSDEERGWFLKEYRRRATSAHARSQLDLLAKQEYSSIPPQRLSPFYFGLCTYDEEFDAVESYVRNHLAPLDKRRREVARYLALVTRYGQLGIPVDLVRRWLTDSLPTADNRSPDLDQILGADLRHLVVVERAELRLLHPLIADEVLLSDEGENPGLAQVAVDFIKMVTQHLGAENNSTQRLLEELFVRRNVWDERIQRREHFSELILNLSVSGAETVFAQLTDRSPHQPHFWNHRGRYLIYQVKGEYRRAEEYLQRAVDESGGRDAVHLHTLGMVRRFWIEDELRKLGQAEEKPKIEEVLEAIKPLFEKALEAFQQAREDPSNSYSWVTPIQLIAEVIEQLVKISDSENLTDLLDHTDAVADWVADQLDNAEALLDDLRWSSAEGRTNSSYNSMLTAKLDELYGDVEGLIERWRELKAADAAPGPFGLAVARTLFAQHGRDWSLLSETAVREIVEMSWDRVREGHASGADLRLWFQAYRRLPEYSEIHAMERFQWYADNRSLLEAQYYLYIMNFVMWERGDRSNQERIRTHMEECRRLSRFNRRQWSYEWLSTEQHQNRLVHFGELGKWDRNLDFWTRPELLQRVPGVIEKITGPQAGLVRIGRGHLTAFFVPGAKFFASRDVNRLVDFNLGFSYEGFRAWRVSPRGEWADILPTAARRPEKRLAKPKDKQAPIGPVADKPATVVTPTSQPMSEPRAHEPARSPHKPIDPALTHGVVARAKVPRADTFTGVIIELIRQAEAAGQTLSSLSLGAALQARFGLAPYQEFRNGSGKLRGAVERLGFRTTPTRSGFDIHLP